MLEYDSNLSPVTLAHICFYSEPAVVHHSLHNSIIISLIRNDKMEIIGKSRHKRTPLMFATMTPNRLLGHNGTGLRQTRMGLGLTHGRLGPNNYLYRHKAEDTRQNVIEGRQG